MFLAQYYRAYSPTIVLSLKPESPPPPPRSGDSLNTAFTQLTAIKDDAELFGVLEEIDKTNITAWLVSREIFDANIDRVVEMISRLNVSNPNDQFTSLLATLAPPTAAGNSNIVVIIQDDVNYAEVGSYYASNFEGANYSTFFPAYAGHKITTKSKRSDGSRTTQTSNYKYSGAPTKCILEGEVTLDDATYASPVCKVSTAAGLVPGNLFNLAGAVEGSEEA